MHSLVSDLMTSCVSGVRVFLLTVCVCVCVCGCVCVIIVVVVVAAAAAVEDLINHTGVVDSDVLVGLFQVNPS